MFSRFKVNFILVRHIRVGIRVMVNFVGSFYFNFYKSHVHTKICMNMAFVEIKVKRANKIYHSEERVKGVIRVMATKNITIFRYPIKPSSHPKIDVKNNQIFL